MTPLTWSLIMLGAALVGGLGSRSLGRWVAAKDPATRSETLSMTSQPPMRAQPRAVIVPVPPIRSWREGENEGDVDVGEKLAEDLEAFLGGLER